MVTQVITKVRRVVRRLGYGRQPVGPSGAEIAASWQTMMDRLDRRSAEVESRLTAAERALNQQRFN